MAFSIGTRETLRDRISDDTFSLSCRLLLLPTRRNHCAISLFGSPRSIFAVPSAAVLFAATLALFQHSAYGLSSPGSACLGKGLKSIVRLLRYLILLLSQSTFRGCDIHWWPDLGSGISTTAEPVCACAFSYPRFSDAGVDHSRKCLQ